MSCDARHPMYDAPCQVEGEHWLDEDSGLPLHVVVRDGERLRWTVRAATTEPTPVGQFVRPGTVVHQPGCPAVANWTAPCSCGEDVAA